MVLKGKTIAVCVTGGIAAYKACEIVSGLKKLGCEVFVVMTENARRFVAPLSFETLSGNKVLCDMFDSARKAEVEHVSLAKKADLFLIAPCTANVVGKITAGIADDFVTTLVMATTKPVLIAPAMNTNMLFSAAYRANEGTLKKRGYLFVESESGMLACGDSGAGRLASPEKIIKNVVDILNIRQDFAGKKVLVTAGATREDIDSVRFLSNKSSGKMGLALAEAAAKRGAEVIVIAGHITAPTSNLYKLVRVNSTQQMHDVTLSLHRNFDRDNSFEDVCADIDAMAKDYAANISKNKTKNLPKDLSNGLSSDECAADYVIMAAAPCDYRPLNISPQKIKSTDLQLSFVKNPDIAAEIGKDKRGSKLIVFAAETENLESNARGKLKNKNADMVVANDVSQEGAGFEIDTNIVTIISAAFAPQTTGVLKKSEVAEIILDKMLCLPK